MKITKKDLLFLAVPVGFFLLYLYRDKIRSIAYPSAANTGTVKGNALTAPIQSVVKAGTDWIGTAINAGIGFFDKNVISSIFSGKSVDVATTPGIETQLPFDYGSYPLETFQSGNYGMEDIFSDSWW